MNLFNLPPWKQPSKLHATLPLRSTPPAQLPANRMRSSPKCWPPSPLIQFPSGHTEANREQRNDGQKTTAS